MVLRRRGKRRSVGGVRLYMSWATDEVDGDAWRRRHWRRYRAVLADAVAQVAAGGRQRDRIHHGFGRDELDAIECSGRMNYLIASLLAQMDPRGVGRSLQSLARGPVASRMQSLAG